MDRSKHNEAKNPNTSPERLQELAEEGFARGVAKNPAAPPPLLERLALSPDKEVRGLVAENPNTPIQRLFKLGATYPARVVRNPLLPLLLLENPDFFSGISHESLRFIMKQKDVPEAFLDWACQNSKHLRIREAIARNPRTPTKILEGLLFDPTETVRVGAAKNPSTPQETLQHLRRAGVNHDLLTQTPPDLSLPGEVLASFMSRGLWVKRVIAAHPNTPIALLETLAKEKNASWLIYVLLVQNPSLPAETLRFLITQRSYLKQSAAKNPSLPEDLLVSFLNDASGHELREALAYNVNLSLERLLLLSEDTNCAVRAAAARNPKLPEARRREMVKDRSLAVRRSLIHSPNLSPAEFLILAQDPKPQVRSVVASSSRAPTEIIEALTKDKHRYTRDKASRNLQRREQPNAEASTA